MFTNGFFFWLVACLFFFVAEMGHPGLFYFLSFSIGSAVAAISTFWLDGFITHFFIFLLGSCIGLAVLKCWVKKQKSVSTKTNAEALIGKVGTVISVDNLQVKVAGEVWSADSASKLEKGDKIVVVEVKGCKLIIKK